MGYVPLAKEMEIYVLFTDVPYAAGSQGSTLILQKKNLFCLNFMKYQVG